MTRKSCHSDSHAKHRGSAWQTLIGMMVLLAATVVVATARAGDDGAPALRVGEVTVETGDIYSSGEITASEPPLSWLKRFMNAVHVDTKEYVIRRELLFREGDVYDPAVLAETARNLRGLGFLNRIEVTATDTLADGRVSVRVRVREVWSLQTSAAFSRSSDGEHPWFVLFSENNFLGHGLRVGLRVGEDEDASFSRLEGAARRIFGSTWNVAAFHSHRSDGESGAVQFYRPFHRQDDPWSFFLRGERFDAERRYYLSNAGLLGGDAKGTQSLHALVPIRRGEVHLRGLWRISGGDGRIWRLGGRGRLVRTRYARDGAPVEMSTGGWRDPAFLDVEGMSARREGGTQLTMQVTVETLGRDWTKTRFLRRFGPVEDVNLDPWVRLDLGMNWYRTGDLAGRSAPRLHCEFYDGSRLAGGLVTVAGIVDAQAGSADLRYGSLDLLARWVRGGRRVAERRGAWLTSVSAEVAAADDVIAEDAFRLGLRRGLRTLSWDDMAGDRLVRWNLERTRVFRRELFGLFNIGAAVFYDGGQAWFDGEDRDWSDLRHEVGVGLRLGPTRAAQIETLHLDLTRDLDGGKVVFTIVTGGNF